MSIRYSVTTDNPIHALRVMFQFQRVSNRAGGRALRSAPRKPRCARSPCVARTAREESASTPWPAQSTVCMSTLAVWYVWPAQSTVCMSTLAVWYVWPAQSTVCRSTLAVWYVWPAQSTVCRSTLAVWYVWPAQSTVCRSTLAVWYV